MSDPPRDSHEASRSDKLRRIAALGIDPWGGRFDNVKPIAQVRALDAVPFEDDPTTRVRVAGRVVLRRTMGKAHFLHVQDQTGRVQVWIGQKQVGEPGWELAQLLDLGDLIGVDGVFGRTKTGEPTVRADTLTILAKSLEPHPDKWSGMQDDEYRLRRRYLDLIYSPETLKRARMRVQLLRRIRRLLDTEGYSEVETPVLQAVAGGAAARPFVTHHNALDLDLYLRIALELPLKRLLVGGLEKVYEIGRVFRNEGISRKHNPEFTMLELYQAYGNYETMMDLTERLIVACVDEVQAAESPREHNYSLSTATGSRMLRYNGVDIDFTPPWPRRKYGVLFREYAGVDMFDQAGVRAAAEKRGLNPAGKDHEVLVQQLYEQCVEPHLAGPIFVQDYPAGLCPLTKRNRADPRLAERFELYVAGMELANAYTELNDPVTQEATFKCQLAGLPEEESMARMDEDFITALRHGMPPAGGLGIGIDRLVMLLTDATHIGDVILFPLLRPERK